MGMTVHSPGQLSFGGAQWSCLKVQHIMLTRAGPCLLMRQCKSGANGQIACHAASLAAPSYIPPCGASLSVQAECKRTAEAASGRTSSLSSIP